MSKPVSRSQTDQGRVIWEGVSQAAESAPEWVKAKVTQAATESANRMASKAAPDPPKK